MNQDAHNSDELGRLGELLGEMRYGEAEQLAMARLAHRPECGLAWKAVGIARLLLGRDALATLHRATQLLPGDASAHFNLGVAFNGAGQFDHALASFTRALEIAPGDLASLRHRADALIALERMAEAAQAYRKLLALFPECAEAHLNLGNILKLLGQGDDAAACYRRALEIDPAFAQAHYNLAIVLDEGGQHAAAVDSYRRALDAAPAYAEAHLNLGNALKRLGRFAEAAASYGAALDIRPDFAEAQLDLGNVLSELGQSEQAIDCFGLALAIKPDFVAAHLNLGNTHKDLGNLDAAIESYRRAIAIDPDFDAAHDNLLFAHTLIVDHDPRAIFADARAFGRRVARRARARSAWPNAATPHKRLRVGLVSGDFRAHPVSYFFESVLGALKRANGSELFAYSNCRHRDATTARIKSLCHAWRDVAGLSDEAVAGQIENDGIDLLVDLSGHIEGNRLPLFAWKSAPVQLSWLGFQATTGLGEIDYIVADRWTVLPEEEAYFTEQVWRLPETLWCLTPPDVALEVSPLPALANGYITFASLNRLEKINDDVVALWARVLHAVAGSRLLLKTGELTRPGARARLGERFARHGIGGERLILEGRSPRADHLAAYRRVDIALDPFPYAGATTTAEGLWMGVPVLTLAGTRFTARQSVSMAMNVDLAEWIALDADDYVARTVRHSSDLQRLAKLRSSLRARALASPSSTRRASRATWKRPGAACGRSGATSNARAPELHGRASSTALAL